MSMSGSLVQAEGGRGGGTPARPWLWTRRKKLMGIHRHKSKQLFQACDGKDAQGAMRQLGHTG